MAFFDQHSFVNREDGGGLPPKPAKPDKPKNNNSSGGGNKKPNYGGSSAPTLSGPTRSEIATMASINAYKSQLNRLLAEKQQSLMSDMRHQQQKLRNNTDAHIKAENDKLSAKYDAHTLDARSAYINYMQNKRTAGQRLASSGITGGSQNGYLTGLDRNYSNQLDDIWTSFSKEQSATNSRIEQLRQQLAQQLQDAEHSYYSKLNSAYQSTQKTLAGLDRQLINIQGKYWQY